MKATMTEDQFKQLLEQNNTTLFGQLSHHFDQRFDALSGDLVSRTDRIFTSVDGIAKRIETDEQERGTINQSKNAKTTGSPNLPKSQTQNSYLNGKAYLHV